MAKSKKRYTARLISALIAVAFVAGLLAGSILSYSTTSQKINDLQDQVSALQDQISNLQQAENTPTENVISLSEMYDGVKDSVVMIRGPTHYGWIQGSGFVYSFEGRMVIVTNFHVVNDTKHITVTFRDGNAYPAEVIGSDPYADLAVLSADAPAGEFSPLQVVSSSTLEVGDPVAAVGGPFGLTGSMTTGIVSQLGRTIEESTTGRFLIANVIQTSAPINPGNSGGPLLNHLGQVVGITARIVRDSQGLGFAIPSNTILREIGSLVENGSYTLHSWLGVVGIDMNYEIAMKMGTDVTSGWLITQVVEGGPADNAGLLGGTKQVQTFGGTVTIGGDLIMAIDGTQVVNADGLSAYLEEHTLPGQPVELTILRDNLTTNLPVELGTRPLPNS